MAAAKRRGQRCCKPSAFSETRKVVLAKALPQEGSLTRPAVAEQISVQVATRFNWFPRRSSRSGTRLRTLRGTPGPREVHRHSPPSSVRRQRGPRESIRAGRLANWRVLGEQSPGLSKK